MPTYDPRILRAWSTKYAYLEIRFFSPGRFFSYIETKYGDELPANGAPPLVVASGRLQTLCAGEPGRHGSDLAGGAYQAWSVPSVALGLAAVFDQRYTD